VEERRDYNVSHLRKARAGLWKLASGNGLWNWLRDGGLWKRLVGTWLRDGGFVEADYGNVAYGNVAYGNVAYGNVAYGNVAYGKRGCGNGEGVVEIWSVNDGRLVTAQTVTEAPLLGAAATAPIVQSSE